MAKSNLRLSKEQEEALVEYCLDRFVQLQNDNRDRIDADKKSKMDYDNSKAYREAKDGVYQYSNLSLPLTSMVVDHFCTRSEEEITGTKPFFHFRPKGPSDGETALKIDRLFLNRLVDVGGLKEDLEDTFHPVFTQRAAVLKATYKEDYCEWEEYDKLALWSMASQAPVQIADGDGGLRYVIYDEEEWHEDVDVDPETLELAVPIRRLKADPSIVITEAQYQAQPDSPVWNGADYYWAPIDEAIRFREFHYRGPQSRQVDYDRFFAPMNISSLDQADCLAEIYDKDVNWARKLWMDGEERMSWQEYEQLLEARGAEDQTESVRTEISKERLAFDRLNKKVRILEVWLTRDVLGWGEPQRIVAYIDRDNRQAVYYEFAAVVLPDRSRRHPYDAIAIWKNENLWWGKSVPEMLEPYQEYVDKLWNSWTFRQAINNGSIIGEHPDATVEGKRLAEIEHFESVELVEGKTMKEWLEVFTFPQTDQQTGNLIDRIFHWVQLWLGVSNIAQGDYSEIPTNTTAYGMDATLREAGRLSRRWTRRIIRGFKSHVELLCRIEFATMDEELVFKYTEGDHDLMDWIRRDAVRNMEVDVELVLSQQHTQAIVEANKLAEEIAVRYADYDPYRQEKVRMLFKSSLKALGHDNVDELIPAPTEEDFEQFRIQQEREAEIQRLTVMQQLGMGPSSQRQGASAEESA